MTHIIRIIFLPNNFELQIPTFKADPVITFLGCIQNHISVFWPYPYQKKWHKVQNTRNYHSSDCDTDHSFISKPYQEFYWRSIRQEMETRRVKTSFFLHYSSAPSYRRCICRGKMDTFKSLLLNHSKRMKWKMWTGIRQTFKW